MNQFDLHDSGIENIGHEFYEDQLIITIKIYVIGVKLHLKMIKKRILLGILFFRC